MKPIFKIFIFLGLQTLVSIYSPQARAERILSTLFLNGFSNLQAVFFPLFCEGQDPDLTKPENACGALEFRFVSREFLSNSRLKAITNITVCERLAGPPCLTAGGTALSCEGNSCVPATNAVFINDFIPELSETLRTSPVIGQLVSTGMGLSLLEGVANNAVVTEHDPLQCAGITGKFKTALQEKGDCLEGGDPIADKLMLDYRCMILVNLETGEEFTFAGSFIIREAD